MTKKRKSTRSRTTKSNAVTRKNTSAKARSSAPAVAKKVNPGRTASGKVPKGRTLSTFDKFFKGGKKTNSAKERPVVVIEASKNNELAVVPLSTTKGKDRTHLRNYQQGQSYFKHYVEIHDDEGKPIKVNQKFKENHPKNDVSGEDVKKIRDKVFNHSRPAPENLAKMEKFRGDKKSPRN